MLQFTDSGWTTFATPLGPVALSWTPAGLNRLHLGAQPGPALFTRPT